MIDYYEIKSQPITRVMVWQAYKKVRANKGSRGIDDMTWQWLDKEPDVTELYQTMEPSNFWQLFSKASKRSTHSKEERRESVN